MNETFEISTQEAARLEPIVGAFVMAASSFLTGSALLLIWGGTPFSSTPLVSTSAHLLWFVAVASLATGAVGLLVKLPLLRDRLAGYLAVGTLGLGVLLGLQWATWAYVDVLAAQHDRHQMVLESIISPFGAGQSLMYGLLVGAGVALLGWELRRTELIHRHLAWAGVGVGTAEVIGTVGVLLIATKSGPFAVTVLLLPLLYVWVGTVAIDIIRQHPVSINTGLRIWSRRTE